MCVVYMYEYYSLCLLSKIDLSTNSDWASAGLDWRRRRRCCRRLDSQSSSHQHFRFTFNKACSSHNINIINTIRRASSTEAIAKLHRLNLPSWWIYFYESWYYNQLSPVFGQYFIFSFRLFAAKSYSRLFSYSEG